MGCAWAADRPSSPFIDTGFTPLRSPRPTLEAADCVFDDELLPSLLRLRGGAFPARRTWLDLAIVLTRSLEVGGPLVVDSGHGLAESIALPPASGES